MLLSMRYADSNGFSAVLIPPILPTSALPTALSTLPAGSGQGIWRGCKKPSRRSQEAGNKQSTRFPQRIQIRQAVLPQQLFLCLRIVQRYNGSHKGTCSGASMDGSSEDALRRRRPSTSSAQPYDKSRSRGRLLQVPSSSGNKIQRSRLPPDLLQNSAFSHGPG